MVQTTNVQSMDKLNKQCNRPKDKSVEDVMDIKALWIGDWLEIMDTGQVGTFEGMRHGLLKVKIDEKIEYLTAEQVRQTEVIKDPQPLDESTTTPLQGSPDFNPVIDLHLDQLKHFAKSGWMQPIDFQKQHCKRFILEAVRLQIRSIKIIHGKGEGVLKATVDDLLHHTPEVRTTRLVNQGGATEVEFHYL